MIEVGAIGFFQTLRLYSPEDIHVEVDVIVENLKNKRIEIENQEKFTQKEHQEEEIVRELESQKAQFNKYEEKQPTKLIIQKSIKKADMMECDKQYLYEINIRLQQRKSEIVQEALEELRKSPLTEFPIEYFVQNTDILRVSTSRNLLQLEKLSPYYSFSKITIPYLRIMKHWIV